MSRSMGIGSRRVRTQSVSKLRGEHAGVFIGIFQGIFEGDNFASSRLFSADLCSWGSLAYRIVLGVSWPTCVGTRCINTQFGATHREDRNRDFLGFFGGLHTGQKAPSLCYFVKIANAVWCVWGFD